MIQEYLLLAFLAAVMILTVVFLTNTFIFHYFYRKRKFSKKQDLPEIIYMILVFLLCACMITYIVQENNIIQEKEEGILDMSLQAMSFIPSDFLD